MRWAGRLLQHQLVEPDGPMEIDGDTAKAPWEFEYTVGGRRNSVLILIQILPPAPCNAAVTAPVGACSSSNAKQACRDPIQFHTVAVQADILDEERQ